MDLQKIFDTYWNVVTTYSVLVTSTQIILGIVLGVIIVILFFRWWYKKELRFYKNSNKKSIFLIKSENNKLEDEIKLIKGTGIFKIGETISYDSTGIDRLEKSKHSLVIIGYSKDMKNFNSFFEKIKTKGIPLVVYSKIKLPDEIFDKCREYSWYSTCQTPLRLISDIFTIFSTYPYGESK